MHYFSIIIIVGYVLGRAGRNLGFYRSSSVSKDHGTLFQESCEMCFQSTFPGSYYMIVSFFKEIGCDTGVYCTRIGLH